MGEDSRALWEALGRPVEGLPLPTAHSPAWRTARNSLRTALAAAGAPSRVRSPRALGLLLRGIPPGPGETWGSLLTGCGWSELCRALRTGNSAAGLRLASWNLRWMVSPHTAQNAAKRNAIRQWIEAGRTVLLQETHWSPEDQAVWGACFPAAQLFAAPAVQGPRGGPQGGVAILLPLGVRVVAHRVLVPGCALEVRAEVEGRAVRFLSLYVPPGDYDRVIASLVVSLALDDTPLFSAGDANLQLHQPREGEEEAVTALRGLLASRGSILVDYTGPSYFGRERGSSIDFASVPAEGAWRWHAQVQRRSGLSDHGCVLLGNAARPPSVASHRKRGTT